MVVTSDLGVGQGAPRLWRGSREGPPLQAESATVRIYFLPPNTDDRELRQTLTAQFQPWPTVAGVFIAYTRFRRGRAVGAGGGVHVLRTARQVVARSAFPVKEVSDTPSIGDPAPASVTPKASEVEDLSRITTAGSPDASLYALSRSTRRIDR